MNDEKMNFDSDSVSRLQYLNCMADKLAEEIKKNPIHIDSFKSIKDTQHAYLTSAVKNSERVQAEKVRAFKIQENILEAVEDINRLKIRNPEKFIIDELCNVLMSFEHRVVEIQNRGEVEISNDIYAAIRRIIEDNKITIERESQVGRAKKKLGETDFYFFRYSDGQREDLAILENKVIEKFIYQYRQVLGYLNPHFMFGITLSINKKYSYEKALQFIEDKLVGELKCLSTEYGPFQITSTSRRHTSPYYIESTHKLPDIDDKEMKMYHLVLNLFDGSRKEIAKKARKK